MHFTLPKFLLASTYIPAQPVPALSGTTGSVLIADEVSHESELDARCDVAEEVLDFYTDRSGTTGSDREDIQSLIVDLLHLLDDIELEEGQVEVDPGRLLDNARMTYFWERA